MVCRLPDIFFMVPASQGRGSRIVDGNQQQQQQQQQFIPTDSSSQEGQPGRAVRWGQEGDSRNQGVDGHV